MLLLHHLELATRAHYGTSFSPEKRGQSYIREHSEELAGDMERVTELGGDAQDYRKRYEQHFVAWMSAKSRCLSSMITGPSGFPTRRAEKANHSEHKRMTEFSEWRKRYFERLEQAQRRAERASIDPIAEMRHKIESAERNQEAMKAANKIIGAKKLSAAEKVERLAADLNIPEAKAATLLEPDFCGRVGFASYLLTNNLANIKRMRERLAELERKAATDTSETVRPDGIRIVENTTADRLQIFFPGKPDGATISRLKASAFKWSPSQGCWQRQLTANARYALRNVLADSVPIP